MASGSRNDDEVAPPKSIDLDVEPHLSFTMFQQLPVEIRLRIWESAITPRIIKCKHSHDRNLFTGPSHPVALLHSREAAFLYGEYDLVSTSPSMVYFSLKYDYLWFDAGWTSFEPPRYRIANRPPPTSHDFTESLPSPSLKLRNIMIHPNWSDKRMKPTVQFANFTKLQRVLVAADERSIGIQSQVMLDTIYDLKMYYTIAKQKLPETKTPKIAVGCLGWTGSEGKRLYHTNEDNRQLVGIFDTYAEMKDHQQSLRELEWKFTRDRFSTPKPSIIAKLQKARELSERNNPTGIGHGEPSSPNNDNLNVQVDIPPNEPPTYTDAVSGDADAGGRILEST
ncbi:hypothetical protein GLAREA_01079 [Glarea lozoyensis ATCC 20868]|uniref:2EXR domain-containing protein n=1 Tax=Glarea lozoyensis (strain ATCC 20868 / MF5171) TaxID=1116229 RepID=S3CY87_GLAL2|nr:uncharacterized protein GLAREA_01079 [Glarea lozoyensis ATCC 20868]EPE29919.1 hypothetical protein GLAREA_01079 [Glarea lozoyensis ATCC 20868]